MDERLERIHAELVNAFFGENLATVRRRRRFSQTQLGRAVGLSRGTISNLEAGSQNVQLYQIFKFAVALDAPVEEFLPRLSDVIVYDNKMGNPDRMFLEFAKRQLININAAGDDNENA